MEDDEGVAGRHVRLLHQLDHPLLDSGIRVSKRLELLLDRLRRLAELLAQSYALCHLLGAHVHSMHLVEHRNLVLAVSSDLDVVYGASEASMLVLETLKLILQFGEQIVGLKRPIKAGDLQRVVGCGDDGSVMISLHAADGPAQPHEIEHEEDRRCQLHPRAQVGRFRG